MKLFNFKILSSFLIFFISFLTHFGYDKFPNLITSFLFPVNESIFEHMKMIFSSYLIYYIIEFFYFRKNNINSINNNSNKILSLTLNIIIFLSIYLPVYYTFGYNTITTLTIYYISILITQLISYKILESKKEYIFFNKYCYFILLIYFLLFIYLTYYPLKEDIFIDKSNNKLGLKNYYT